MKEKEEELHIFTSPLSYWHRQLERGKECIQKSILRRPKRSWDSNIKIDLRQISWRAGVSSGSPPTVGLLLAVLYHKDSYLIVPHTLGTASLNTRAV